MTPEKALETVEAYAAEYAKAYSLVYKVVVKELHSQFKHIALPDTEDALAHEVALECCRSWFERQASDVSMVSVALAPGRPHTELSGFSGISWVEND